MLPLYRMVNSYLVHNGYSQTAEAFARTTGQSLREDLSSMRNRQSEFPPLKNFSKDIIYIFCYL